MHKSSLLGAKTHINMPYLEPKPTHTNILTWEPKHAPLWPLRTQTFNKEPSWTPKYDKLPSWEQSCVLKCPPWSQNTNLSASRKLNENIKAPTWDPKHTLKFTFWSQFMHT